MIAKFWCRWGLGLLCLLPTGVGAEPPALAVLIAVDQLRRELKANHDRAMRLRKENTTLGRSLPGSSRATKVSRK